MTPDDKDLTLQDQLGIALGLLGRIAVSLETIAQHQGALAFAAMPQSPNLRHSLAEYPDFDWSSIGAEVKGEDRDGVTAVAWGGYVWKRRSPQNNFKEAIYFSRPTKKVGDKTEFARLITFAEPTEVKRIPRDLAETVGEATERQALAAAQRTVRQAKPAAALAAPAIATQAPTPAAPQAPQDAAQHADPQEPAQAPKSAHKSAQAPQPTRQAPAGKYDPTFDTRLRSLARPSAALALEDLKGPKLTPTLFYHLARVFTVDLDTAKDIWREKGSTDPSEAIKALDQHVF